jgi:uroporphyrinogen decarboxylase
MKETMNHRQRILAAVSGDPVDRPPVSMWGHAYHRESTASDLAQATLEFWEKHEWDFVKLNPRASYHAEVWGLSMQYSGVPDEKPKRIDHPIKQIGDWAAITPKGIDAPPLTEQIETVQLLRQALPEDVLLVETVFSPLSIAADLVQAPEAILNHLREDETAVRRALQTITETFQSFVAAVMRAGADGIYFATVDWATRELLTAEEYARYARPYDLAVLREAIGATYNLVHVCRSKNMLEELADYPAHVFSWASTDPTNPDLEQGLKWFSGAAAGGIDQARALLEPTPDAVMEQLQAGFQQTDGRRWIVAPGCSILPETPEGNLTALRSALVEQTQEKT